GVRHHGRGGHGARIPDRRTPRRLPGADPRCLRAASRRYGDRIVNAHADVLDIGTDEVDPGAPWESLGVDSAMTLVLVADLSVVLGRTVQPIEVLSNPTIDAVVEHLVTVE